MTKQPKVTFVIREKLEFKEKLDNDVNKLKDKRQAHADASGDEKDKDLKDIKAVILELLKGTSLEQAHPPTYGVDQEIDPD